MTAADILITKIRTGGNQMIRADVKGRSGHDTFINVSALGVDEAIRVAGDYEIKYAAIKEELEKVRAQGVDW